MEPIEVSVIRAWDGIVVTAWWDEAVAEKEPWLNIRSFKVGNLAERTFRFSPKEVEKLLVVIKHGKLPNG